MTLDRMMVLLDIEKECVITAAHDGCDRDCAKCILLQDDHELTEMYSKVIGNLHELERAAKENRPPRIIT